MAANWNAVFARVRGALMRRGRTVHDAEDLVQEAWLRLAIYEQEQIVERPEAFLMKTALNLSVDHHRAQVNRGEEVLVDEVLLVDATPGAEASLLARERLIRVSMCLDRLSAKTRDIFLLHRVDGLSYQEIARQYGLNVSTVEKHVARAMLQVTRWMEGW